MSFARRRRRVLVAWLVLVVAGATVGRSLSGVLQHAFTAPGSDSAQGAEALKAAFGEGGEYPFVLVRTYRTPIGAGSAAVRELEREAADVAARVSRSERHEVEIAGGRTAYAAITSTDRSADLASLTPRIRSVIGSASFSTLLTGTAVLEYDSRQVLARDLRTAELVAFPLAAIVLVVLLQTAVAALVPVLLALAVIPTSMGAIWLLAHVTDMSIYVTNVATLLGIALSLDYSLLVVSRLQEEERSGVSNRRALERTLATAGRTATFSAVTVATGLAVLLFIPLPFMRSMGLAGVVVPLVAAAATSTLLPALLATLGPRINRGRIAPAAGYSFFGSRGWTRKLAGALASHPARSFSVGALLLVALAVPAGAIRVTGGDIRSLPQGMPSDRGLKALTDALGPGALSPYEIVLTAPDSHALGSERARLDISQLLFALSKDPEVVDVEASPIGSRTSSSGRVVEIGFIGRHPAGSAQAETLVGRIRSQYGGLRPPGTQMHLAGAAALGVDFVHTTYDKFIWIVLAIVGFALILLTYIFRSLLLPVKAVILNCASVAASVGIVVLAVQTGLADHLGLRHASQIEAWVPAFLFAVLFGLSMDYHIFIVARIREEWLRGKPMNEAVKSGLARTNRVVRAAAAVMIVTFAGFLGSSFADVQKLGIGLTFGVILDVYLVRGLLVPSAMRVIGEWNWYFPKLNRARATGAAMSEMIGETSD
jgi:RND superfamily putative drug exporter